MKKIVLITLALIVGVLLAAYSVRAFSRSKPQIAGASCEEWARSYGTQLEHQSLAILDGTKWPTEQPALDQVGDEVLTALNETRSKVSQALHALYVRDPGAFANCSPEQFFSIAEQEFGPRFRQEVPRRLATLGPRPDWTWYRTLIQKEVEVALQPE